MVLTQIQRLYHWMGVQVYSPYAEYMLGFLFYLEAIFFLPTDPMLILFCIERREKAFRYATIATIASVIGGLSSYIIGLTLWQWCGEHIIHNRLINYIITPSLFESLCIQFREHDWLAILIAGFTPIPYKAATLAAGFCKLSLIPFIICSFIARGARFFLLACIINIFGIQIKNSVEQFFNLIVITTSIIIFVTIVFIYYLR